MSDDDEWMVKGWYEFVIHNDEEVIWSKVDGNFESSLYVLKNLPGNICF